MVARQALRAIDLGRRLAHAPHGLTRIPNSANSVTSDLFIWRRDSDWETDFELLDILSLIDPKGDPPERRVKLVVFDARGTIVADELIDVVPNVRLSLHLRDYVPASAGDFGTFACFHLGVDPGLIPVGTFLAERGYCGYGRRSEGPRSFVHGNLDAVAWSAQGLELLGTRGLVSSRYQLQLVIEPGALFELAIVNPSRQPIKVEILQNGRDGKESSSIRLAPRGSCIKSLAGGRKFESLVSLKSKLPMARPVVFFTSGSYFDVFHG